MHVIGSFSSSEEDLATTPDYTSCDEPDSESRHANSMLTNSNAAGSDG